MKKMMLSLVVLSAAVLPVSAQVTSALWGVEGEAWNTNGLLRDFSTVGYMSGSEAIPDWPVGVNVTNYGAVADDDLDDTQAFRDAIAACPSNSAVFVPNGIYNIEQQIVVSNKNNFVLRGEDMYDTVLWMPYYLTEIPGAENTAFFYVDGGYQTSIENFSFIFRNQPKGGHWEALGADAIQYVGVNQSWIRNIYIKNSDHGIGLSSMWSQHISVMNIILDQYMGRKDMEGTAAVGHMGITVYDAGYHLIDNVKLTGSWHHDVNAQGGKNSVWSRITGPKLGLDHHAMGSVYNLWTEIDFGLG
ncbi:MAG TPA: glycosyl hydrolase family 28-related protein, partial [Tichowtungia sp.]|nr:glycosyl hydrolase family 28-related protein [Tichowtungia sp.]